jgi:ABC-type lipoprotein export system ATPase subunit
VEEGMTETNVVETKNLVKLYGEGAQVRALDGVNLVVKAGEFVAIIGPSGSGKSTLLNMLGALDRPTSGEVIIQGTSLAGVRALDQFRSRTVGFVFQTHNLIPTLTARENVEVPMQGTGRGAGNHRLRAEELLGLVGLEPRMNFLPNQLSGGERQRVAIARALANRPAIVLADEPTGNLDSQNTADIMALLAKLNTSQGTTLIVVTHNHEVARITRRVITLRDGRIHQDVPIKSSFDSDWMDFKASSLGQAILRDEGVPESMRDLAPRLRQLLEQM